MAGSQVTANLDSGSGVWSLEGGLHSGDDDERKSAVDIALLFLSGLEARIFSGFTRLCKGLAVILVGGYAIVRFLPSSITCLALIPGRTIPFAWNLITAGYVEQSVFGVLVSVIGLMFVGKFLEPLWGSREFLKFILVVNVMTFASVFVTAVVLYYVTNRESYLYTPFYGFHGVLSGFLVGLKQVLPEQEMALFSPLKVKVKWLPSLTLLLSVATSFFTTDSITYLPILIFGTYTSWIYLRYLQKNPETNFSGDPSDDFAFATFFPQIIRPVVDPVASVMDQMFCRSRGSTREPEPESHILGSSSTASDSREASRRRERGGKALEERLAAERAASDGRENAAYNV